MENSKNLDSKVIVYDDVCPLCKAYTSGFVRAGWLRPENRIGFAEAPAELLGQIDIDRARHEIPLYDRITGETLYGKEALFFILGEAIPIFRPLFRMRLFRAFIFCLYQIITYNRRIIANSRPPAKGFDCAPDFNAFYRWLYIGLMGMGAGLLFYSATPNFDLFLGILVLLVGVAIVIGYLIPSISIQTDYFGHLATVLFIIAMLHFGLQSFHIPFTIPTITLLGTWLFYRRAVDFW
jgi:predicted DCC family thiol-disulfide oxidoreductase YuxK